MFSKAEQETFIRAMDSRDYRFDGRFFTAVKTTGIYCRPICPARPNRKNIIFFKTAREADLAGYRPCLRCRPEVAPESPAWMGTSAIVRRAVSLIADGKMLLENEKKFASRFGITERHLRRLFVEEMGMTPKQISDTQRLNFAKTLVIETALPITEIALTSGFNSIRRFNDAFQKKFSQKPSNTRKRKVNEKAGDVTTLYLRYRPPFDWTSIIEFLKSHATPKVEAVVEDIYHRLFIDENTKKPALLTVSNLPEKFCLKLEIRGAHVKSLFSISRKVRRMFDLDSDPLLVANTFSKSKLLEKIYHKNPGMRIPRGWDAFETSVGIILGQLVTVQQGRLLLEQLVQECGVKVEHNFDTPLTHVFATPEILEKTSLESVRSTQQRKEAIRTLARRVRIKELDFSDASDFNSLRAALNEIKGIGPWTVECICLWALGDTDAFPNRDLILARVLKKHPELMKIDVRPWRSYLAIYLWREYAEKFSRKRPFKQVV